jgi:hypothetical protein
VTFTITRSRSILGPSTGYSCGSREHRSPIRARADREPRIDVRRLVWRLALANQAGKSPVSDESALQRHYLFRIGPGSRFSRCEDDREDESWRDQIDRCHLLLVRVAGPWEARGLTQTDPSLYWLPYHSINHHLQLRGTIIY